MKYILGIYSLSITLYYIAFFTFAGDFIHGKYTQPYLILATLLLLGAFILDVISKQGIKKAKTYALTLLYINIPAVVIAFFVPLVNGNRTIDEILIYNIPLTIGMFLGLFITAPVIGFGFGLVIDAWRMPKGKFTKVDQIVP